MSVASGSRIKLQSTIGVIYRLCLSPNFCEPCWLFFSLLEEFPTPPFTEFSLKPTFWLLGCFCPSSSHLLVHDTITRYVIQLNWLFCKPPLQLCSYHSSQEKTASRELGLETQEVSGTEVVKMMKMFYEEAILLSPELEGKDTKASIS